jgi:ethanolamine utilization protein EutP (predicted NTPase)
LEALFIGNGTEIGVKEDDIKLLDGTDITFKGSVANNRTGLIQYLFYVWAEELGCVIRPDMIFFTIMSEIKNHIVDHPEAFRSIFTKSQDKTTIILVNLTVESLMSALSKIIVNKDLFKVVTQTSFASAPELFRKTMAITMADMGSPLFDYATTKCGIRSIQVLGTDEEWDNLLASIDELIKIFGSIQVNEKDWRI